MDVFHCLLNTVEITAGQFLWAVVPAVGLLLVCELGKLVARRAVRAPSPAPSGGR